MSWWTQKTNANTVLVQKVMRRDNLVKRLRWENNIKMENKEHWV